MKAYDIVVWVKGYEASEDGKLSEVVAYSLRVGLDDRAILDKAFGVATLVAESATDLIRMAVEKMNSEALASRMEADDGAPGDSGPDS